MDPLTDGATVDAASSAPDEYLAEALRSMRTGESVLVLVDTARDRDIAVVMASDCLVEGERANHVAARVTSPTGGSISVSAVTQTAGRGVCPDVLINLTTDEHGDDWAVDLALIALFARVVSFA